MRSLSTLLGLLCLLAWAPNASAQRNGFGSGQQAPPKKKEAVIPKPVVLEPVTPSEELDEARERARESGVLRAAKPKKDEIYEIRVEGARKTEPDAVLVQIRSRVGTKINKTILQRDVRRLFQMALFDDIVVSVGKGPNDSIILIFALTEKPSLAKIRFEDNRAISDEDIDEVVNLRAYQILDVARIRKNVEKIKKLYVDKGYFLADVTYEIVPSEGDVDRRDPTPSLFDSFEDRDPEVVLKSVDPDAATFVDVIFHVDEAAKVRVETIRLEGNEKISSDKIKSVLRTRENHPLGIVTEWGTYKEEQNEIDLLIIDQIYQEEGYINVRVGKPRIALSSDKTRLDMTIPIDEGEQFRLNSFDIQGDLLLDDPAEIERLQNENPDLILFQKGKVLLRTTIKSGDVFKRSQVAQDVQAVADRYRDEGYAYVNIVPDLRVNDLERTVDLVLRIQSGPRVKVERIEITGNSKTQDRVIRRELRIYEGEFFAASGLRRSEQRVNALGFFEKAEFTTKQGSAPDRMQVIVDVTEKPTGTFQLGAGYSNAEKVIFTGQVAQNNFLGRGYTINMSAQLSSFRRIVDARLVDPYFFYLGKEPITSAVSAFNTQRNFIDFFRNSTGGDFTLGYAIGRPFANLTTGLQKEASPDLLPYIPDLENLQLFLTYSGERVEIQDSSFDVNLVGLSPNIPRYTTSLRSSLIFDQRNNRLFPSKGWFFQSQAEFAKPFLGSGGLPGAESALKSFLRNNTPKGTNLGWLKASGRPNDFTRLSFTGRSYYNFDSLLPLKGVVLKANVELGLLLTDDPTLVFERYFLGGFNTIRGYSPRSLGPVARVGGLDPTSQLQEFRTGGDKQFFTNIELEFPIVEAVGIRGVLFFDAGNAYGPDENLFYAGNGPTEFLSAVDCGDERCFDPRRDLALGLYKSAGFGVRWFSPIGPLRFEWGIPLDARPLGTFGLRQGDLPILFEFNIGNSF